MSVSAVEFLSSKETAIAHGVLVMYGPERFFRAEILHCLPGVSGEDAESSITRINGEHAEIREVLTELRTVSMFGDQRIVFIEDADDFVSANRPQLEKYAASPAKGSLLILDVKSFPKTTKLFKLVEQHGLVVECADLTGAALIKWLQRVAKDQYGKSLDRDNAALIVQLAGDGLGMLLQEVAKLASLVGEVADITRDDVVKATTLFGNASRSTSFASSCWSAVSNRTSAATPFGSADMKGMPLSFSVLRICVSVA